MQTEMIYLYVSTFFHLVLKVFCVFRPYGTLRKLVNLVQYLEVLTIGKEWAYFLIHLIMMERFVSVNY